MPVPSLAPILEPAARALVRDGGAPYDLRRGPVLAREAFTAAQTCDGLDRPPVDVDVEDVMVPGHRSAPVAVRIFRPAGVAGPLPAVVYAHGPGWTLGGADTHDRLMRELAGRSGAAIVFVEYSLSPEARYPTALRECSAVLAWVAADGERRNLDPSRIAVAGDSAGANLAIASTLVAKAGRGPRLRGQLLFCPVTDAGFGTASYRQFADGYCLQAWTMRRFWDHYTSSPAERAETTASPLRATRDELADLPAALVITAEADILRDEGEAYAANLLAAGVEVTAVRYRGTVSDFVTLEALRETNAARAAIRQAAGFLAEALERS